MKIDIVDLKLRTVVTPLSSIMSVKIEQLLSRTLLSGRRISVNNYVRESNVSDLSKALTNLIVITVINFRKLILHLVMIK